MIVLTNFQDVNITKSKPIITAFNLRVVTKSTFLLQMFKCTSITTEKTMQFNGKDFSGRIDYKLFCERNDFEIEFL